MILLNRPLPLLISLSTLKAATSAGIEIQNVSGSSVVTFGAGGGQSAAFADGISCAMVNSTSASGVQNQQASTQDAIRILGRAGGTGSYIATLTPTTLTASRTYTFPDAAITVAGSASALTSGRVPFATTGGLLTDSGALRYSGGAFYAGDASTTGYVVMDAALSGSHGFAIQNNGKNCWSH